MVEFILVILLIGPGGQMSTVTVPGFKTSAECVLQGSYLRSPYEVKSHITCMEQKKK